MKKRALVLLSGGLDSILAAWLIKKQGIEIKALIFKSYFFSSEKGIEAAKQLKIPYQVIDFSQEHLKMVKKPKYGYGKAANPCLDCHILMLKKGREILEKENFDFLATGEVLGQRPFSQNKKALILIAQESGLKEKLLRPLSANLLLPTLPEKKKWLERSKFLEIKGRGRKEQINLAKKIGLQFPQPAGGCILCENEFGQKLKALLEKKPDFKGNDAELLKFGRHFWRGKTKIILGKNQEENKRLENLAQANDFLIQPANFIGPTALVGGKKKSIEKAKELILKYSKKTKPQKRAIVFFGSSHESVLILKMLLKVNMPLALIITKPDQPAGRGQKLKPTPVAVFGQENNLPVLKWEKLDFESLEKTKKKIKNQSLLGITAVYGNFIPDPWLDWLGININLHPSLLPKWRGAAPVIRSLEAGGKTTAMTFFKIVKEMDAGPIIEQVKTEIKTNETAGELINRLFQLGGKKLIQVLKPIINSKKPEFWILKPQEHQEATLAPKIEKREAEINWQMPVQKILNLIRAFNPWPGAFTLIKIKNKKLRLKIWQAHLEKGVLIPDLVQLEGKNKISWIQFQKAYPAIKSPRPEK